MPAVRVCACVCVCMHLCPRRGTSVGFTYRRPTTTLLATTTPALAFSHERRPFERRRSTPYARAPRDTCAPPRVESSRSARKARSAVEIDRRPPVTASASARARGHARLSRRPRAGKFPRTFRSSRQRGRYEKEKRKKSKIPSTRVSRIFSEFFLDRSRAA